MRNAQFAIGVWRQSGYYEATEERASGAISDEETQ